MDIKRLFILFTLFFLGNITFAWGQGTSELAMAKANKALKLQKQGKPDEAIALLEDARKIEPANSTYLYQLGTSYNKKMYLTKTVNLLTAALDEEYVNDSIYALLGETYKRLGKSSLALETLANGIGKFPKSGVLYEQMGAIESQKKNFEKALEYYEKGIEMDPGYPGNYYHAAKIFLKGPEEVWGVMYGELFMNLERNSARNLEISRLIYNTFKTQIKVDPGHSKLNMTEEEFIKSDNPRADLMHPFAKAVFEQIWLVSMLHEEKINIYSLDRIRRNFVTYFFNGNISKKYPNALLEYQREAEKAGHLEAYNYWVFRHGDPNGFTIWKAAYKNKWASFEQWFPSNLIKLSDSNKLYRKLYDPAKYKPGAW
jgi:tetratricopeptide (TPR) repeat protein